jgi:DNA-binding NarL/FixJ family response regulator
MIPPSKKILIVDDSLLILSRLVTLVEKSPVVESIFTARTCQEAIDILRSVRIDMALFDIHLPDKSGIELLRFTKGLYPDLCIVMFTNQSDPQVQKTCLELGAQYFLDKSKDFPLLARLIDDL